MPIQVTCPGCRKRFTVSDKFAGQKGPCPNCKTVITIPSKSEEVVVHAPEEFGPKDSAGRAVLKPIFRTETRFSIKTAVAIGVVVLCVLIAALLLRSKDGKVSRPILATGAVLLGPALALAGYTFLRNDELEPHRGNSLLIRSLICGIVYAGLWGLYSLGVWYLNEGDQPELFMMLFIGPVIVGIGAATAAATFDFDFLTGGFHYGLYLLVTVLLRVIMGMKPY